VCKLSGITALTLAIFASPVLAQAPFYQGKQVKILVGFSPGGGTDLYGRVIADGLARHIEGKPNVVVQHMPGAGSVIAMNNYANKVPRDGGTLIIGIGQLLMRILLGVDGARARISDFQALVATPMGRITYASPSSGIKSAKDILTPREPLILGVPEVISTIDAVLGLTVLKAASRPVMGYPGKSDIRLALLRDEINVDSQTTPIYEQSVRPLVAEGKAVPLFAQGLMSGERLLRDPAAPDIPTVADAYREIYGADPAGQAWDAYKAATRAVGNGGKILMIHGDAPLAARAAVKRGIVAMIKDAEFLKMSESALEGYGFNTGEQLEANIAAIGSMDAESISWLQELFSRDFRMKFH
jgi:tripartite-type tricarboxylate transporter receptor subunit TctC